MITGFLLNKKKQGIYYLFDYYLLLIIINIFQYTDYGIALFSLDNGKTKFFDLVQMIDFYQLNQVMPPGRAGHATTLPRDNATTLPLQIVDYFILSIHSL